LYYQQWQQKTVLKTNVVFKLLCIAKYKFSKKQISKKVEYAVINSAVLPETLKPENLFGAVVKMAKQTNLYSRKNIRVRCCTQTFDSKIGTDTVVLKLLRNESRMATYFGRCRQFNQTL
jgi:hypothetical protein